MVSVIWFICDAQEGTFCLNQSTSQPDSQRSFYTLLEVILISNLFQSSLEQNIHFFWWLLWKRWSISYNCAVYPTVFDYIFMNLFAISFLYSFLLLEYCFKKPFFPGDICGRNDCLHWEIKEGFMMFMNLITLTNDFLNSAHCVYPFSNGKNSPYIVILCIWWLNECHCNYFYVQSLCLCWEHSWQVEAIIVHFWLIFISCFTDDHSTNTGKHLKIKIKKRSFGSPSQSLAGI